LRIVPQKVGRRHRDKRRASIAESEPRGKNFKRRFKLRIL
jgi:hypothetical protein